MKRILFITAVLLFVLKSHAQTNDHVWEKLKIDSVSFASKYGTECEYGFQQDILYKSRHGFGALIIGAKINYLDRLASYLGNIYNYEGDFNNGLVFTPKIYSKKPYKILLSHGDDKNDRVLWVKITGPADDIINIFIKYWEHSQISLNDLKSKKTVYQDFGSDRITFSWKGVNPLITISNVPGRTYIPKNCKP